MTFSEQLYASSHASSPPSSFCANNATDDAGSALTIEKVPFRLVCLRYGTADRSSCLESAQTGWGAYLAELLSSGCGLI